MNVFHQEQTCLRTLPEQEAGRREAAQKTHSNNGDLVLDGIEPIFEHSLKIRLLKKAKLSIVDYDKLSDQ